jgi:hypothetical protein
VSERGSETDSSMAEGTPRHVVDEELSDPASYLTVRRRYGAGAVAGVGRSRFTFSGS